MFDWKFLKLQENVNFVQLRTLEFQIISINYHHSKKKGRKFLWKWKQSYMVPVPHSIYAR